MSLPAWKGLVAVAVCVGTRRDGTPCTVTVAQERDYCYHHDPDPEIAARRSRNASKAAILGNSRIGAEIRSTRLLVREIVEMTLANDLHPAVKKRLTEIVQLLQVYARLSELEIAAGGRPKFSEPGEYSLPSDTAEKVKERAGKEAEKETFMQTIDAFNKDPVGTLKAMR